MSNVAVGSAKSLESPDTLFQCGQLPSVPLDMSEFFEAIWHGEGIGDGADLEEALQAYLLVQPEDGNWVQACGIDGADPQVERFDSFDAYLDNVDPLETIAVTPKMIADAIALLPT